MIELSWIEMFDNAVEKGIFGRDDVDKIIKLMQLGLWANAIGKATIFDCKHTLEHTDELDWVKGSIDLCKEAIKAIPKDEI